MFIEEINLNDIVSLDRPGSNPNPWIKTNLCPTYSSNSDILNKILKTRLELNPESKDDLDLFESDADHIFEMCCIDGLVYFIGQLGYFETLDSSTNTMFQGHARRKSFIPTISIPNSNSRKTSAPVQGLIFFHPQQPDQKQSIHSNQIYKWIAPMIGNVIQEDDINETTYRTTILPPPLGTGLDLAKHLEMAIRQSLLPLTSRTSSKKKFKENADDSLCSNQNKLSRSEVGSQNVHQQHSSDEASNFDDKEQKDILHLEVNLIHNPEIIEKVKSGEETTMTENELSKETCEITGKQYFNICLFVFQSS